MWAERIYRWLLRLYPPRERESWGEDMVDTYLRRAAGRAGDGVVRRGLFHVREWAGVAAAATRSRLRPGGAPTAGRRRRGRGGPPRGEGGPSPGSRLAEAARYARHGTRRLARNPGFAATSMVTLALGIGACVSIYGVVDSVVLNPLPYPEPDHLVQLDNAAPGIGSTSGLGFTPGMVYHASRHQRTLEAMAGYDGDEATLTGDGDPERVRVTLATPSLGEVLGVRPLHGRWFLEGEGGRDRAPVTVLSHSLWRRRYGADPDVVGRTIRIDRRPVEVVGVMPSSFRFPEPDVALWLPLHLDASTDFGGFWYRAIGRMKPGLTPDDVLADSRRLVETLVRSFPAERARIRSTLDAAGLTPLVIPLEEAVVGDVAGTLWILLGTVGIVLLVACANVANLFLVRAETRQRDLALRTALGAGRRELVLESLSESALLSTIGGLLGVGAAYAGIRLLTLHGPATLPRIHEVGLDGSVLAVAFAITAGSAVAFGAIPLLRRRPAGMALRAGGPGGGADRVRARGRNLLVAGQMASALVLLAGSGLMVRSFLHLRAVDPGFEASGDVLTFELGLPRSDYPDDVSAAAFHQGLVDRIEGLPGVEVAGVVTCLPIQGWCAGDPLNVEGRDVPEGTIPPIVALRRAGPGYFRAMGIEVVAGRALERADHEGGGAVVVVNRALADRYFPGEDPLGKRVAVGGDTTWSTIVGVVESVPARDLMQGADPLVYFPLAGPGFGGVAPHQAAVAVRARNATGLLDAIRAELAALDDDVALARVRTTGTIVADASARLAFTMVLFVVAGAVALLLGAVGLYGVVSYVVGRRRAEMGVRMALGARARDVRRMVVHQGALVAGAGLAVGWAGALVLTRFLETLVFGVDPGDPATLVAVSVVLMAIAVTASWLPARRAARVDPAEALRAE